ncbi:MAG: DUF169 domain-containing protein [Acidobacteriaceae bacterium]|nr:DUF169 domain-containing protein [Acidobacteriaceae bacterium]
MQYTDVAEKIGAMLGLATPPVALSFVEGPPEGIATTEQAVPSACSFWRVAETGLFYAPADKHFNCPIGSMTMGFDLPPEVQQNLMGFVQMMTGNGYIAADEPPNIPTVKKQSGGIVYGPLKDFPFEPDVVLCWLTPRQAMLYNEAVGQAHWTEHAPSTPLGRPACAALPTALNSAQPQLSMGCTGMRTFTDISDDRLLVVLPGAKLSELLQSLEATIESNGKMQEFYSQHKASFPPLNA